MNDIGIDYLGGKRRAYEQWLKDNENDIYSQQQRAMNTNIPMSSLGVTPVKPSDQWEIPFIIGNMHDKFNPNATLAVQYKTSKPMRRIVTVIIADPSPSVHLDDAQLFHEGPFITEGTDEDIYHEICLQGILDNWNERRVNIDDTHGDMYMTGSGQSIVTRKLKELKASEAIKKVLVHHQW